MSKAQRAPRKDGEPAQPIAVDALPMEARPVAALPDGPEWQYEPKWDGFRCLAHRAGGAVDLRSKTATPLARYFPDLAAALERWGPARFVLDGEIVVPVDGKPSFDELQLRLHPAASRVAALAARHPCVYIVFDLLVDAAGRPIAELKLRDRRPRLERFAADLPAEIAATVTLSPVAYDRPAALRWCDEIGTSLDGIIAKRRDLSYRFGERDGMVKYKPQRTADVVVGGFRYGKDSRLVGSLLLGLYDAAGLLHHVGFTAAIPAAEKPALTRRLEGLEGGPGFTGRAPGGPSRWSSERSADWHPVEPKLVAEIRYDHVSGGRFRHGTTLLRWRPDKPPELCRMDQIEQR